MSVQPKDLSHHLSVESASRKPSPLKAIAGAVSKKGINVISLAGGLPNPQYFPFREMGAEIPSIGSWVRGAENEGKLSNVSVSMDSENQDDLPLSVALQYGKGAGCAPLSKFLKEHTQLIHSPPYKDWDILLTTGNTQALDMCLRMLLNRGDSILVEKYTFPSALQAMRPMDLNIVSVDMDQNGMLPESLEQILINWKDGNKPRVLYTIPSGQNPTGSTLSVERKEKIYALAQQHDFIIIEDEPYYYLQMDEYQHKPEAVDPKFTNEEFVKNLITSFLHFDVDGRVIRMDSLSKVVAPGSRVGWVTAQPMFIERSLRYTETASQNASGISQALLQALFQTWGHDGYLAWLKNIRFSYTERRNALLYAMEKHLPKSICSYIAPEAGMFIWFEVDKSAYKFADQGKSIAEIESEIHDEAIQDGANVACGNWFVVDSSINDKIFFRVTFAYAELSEFEIAIERFANVLKKFFNF
ncbi:aromatic aminotransferase [Schizosaccharomyces osmophilus]|uniref:aromatic-amino-acid transaminase n=1 Tax=Schizosaccharomyces osmophilus TaxID=2545709 RepID=A0AAE9WAF4_9SCHI|nr:aromatic aminotransferase [Schizosaccharomyces osmophilus]WBW72671.1 aromatic aminotransferase [Schizosaccharomyces osmophilus]